MRFHRIERLVSVSLLVFGLAACMTSGHQPNPTTGTPLPPAPAPIATPPSVHVWHYLRAFGAEPSGYATYSYVLAGRDASDAASARRFAALVAAIQDSTPGAADLPGYVERDVMNVFLIPASKNTDTANIPLSKSLLAALAASDSRFLKPGPFIVTLHQPISFSGSPDLSMLFVDLTNTHPLAMSEIATAYKRRLSDRPLKGMEQLSELRLSLLNAALVTEEAIGFASASYAQVKAAFLAE